MHSQTKFSKKAILLPIFFLIGIVLYTTVNAWSLIFSDLNQTSLDASFSQIHFESPGNSFGGGVFWLPVKSQNPIDISITDKNASKQTKTCTNQIRGLYYNDARGSRLRPLDLDTLNMLKGSDPSYNNLSLTGGFFTTCSAENDRYSIYGYIEFSLSGTTSYIMAGVTMNYNSNSYGHQFKDGFQYFNNKTPLGYIWDSIGGIGFIGGQITGSAELIDYINAGGSINSAFALSGDSYIVSNTSSYNFNSATSGNAADTMWHLLVQGNSIISRAIDVFEKKSLFGNLDKRTVLISSTDINSATVVNIAKKNTETLCRGNEIKKTNGNSPILTNGSSVSSVVCYTDSEDLTLNLNSSDYSGKTIILKNSNLTLKGNMTKDSAPLDIFIDGGNLYIDNLNGSKTAFNDQGFPASSGSGINQGLFLKGNFIINGLLLGGNYGQPKVIENKMHIHGKLISLNSLGVATQGRIDQVAEVLKTDPDALKNYISLENVFAWYCSPISGKGSDGSDCGSAAGKITSTPLVILDGTFPTRVIK